MPCTITDALYDGTGRPVAGRLVAAAPALLAGLSVQGSPLSGPYPATETGTDGRFSLTLPDAGVTGPEPVTWTMLIGDGYISGIPHNGGFTIAGLLATGWDVDPAPSLALRLRLENATPRVRFSAIARRTLPFRPPDALGTLRIPTIRRVPSAVLASDAAITGSASTTSPGGTTLIAATGAIATQSQIAVNGSATATTVSGTPTSPVTTTNIHLSATFNYSETISSGQMVGEYPDASYVWGADGKNSSPGYDGAPTIPNTTNIPAQGGYVYHEYYINFGYDNNIQWNNSVTWFKTNHPDWLMYQNDQTTLIFTDAADQTNQREPALDYANPTVQDFILNNYVLPPLANGYNGISLDNNPSKNTFGMAGHFDTSGAWVQQYSGAASDSVYANNMANAITYFVTQARAQYPSCTFSVNNGLDFSFAPSLWSGPSNAGHIVFDEQGFQRPSNYVCTTWPSTSYSSNPWLDKVKQYVSFQKSTGKGIVLNWYPSYTMTANLTTTNSTVRADVQWNLANYLLIKYDHTYLDCSQNMHEVVWQPEYGAAIGSPSGDYYSAQGVYMRDYTNGRAVVNPDSANAYTVTFPAGTYTDLYGNAITSVTMPAISGLVLLLA